MERVEEEGAVFGDDIFKEIQVGEDAFEIGDFAAGDHEEANAGGAGALESGERGVVHYAVGGERAIVIGGENLVFHDAFSTVHFDGFLPNSKAAGEGIVISTEAFWI